MPMTKARYRVKDSSHREDGVTYMKGEVVETDKDLVLLFGAEKFEHLSGTPTKTGKHKPFNPRDLLRANAKAQAAPGGQVHDGKQKATVDGDGNPSSTILQPDEDPNPPKGTSTKAGVKDDEEEDDDVDFNTMTVAELQKYAKENKIDLGSAKSKADIVEALEDAEG